MNTRQKVYEILDGFQTAMLVTSAADGSLESRPMQLVEVEPAGRIWLLTAERTRKVDEVAEHPEVLLVCQDERSQYLSLRGRASLIHDSARVRRLWREPLRVWFPKGPDTPDIALIAITPISAEFWDSSGANRLEYLWEAARAYVTGEQPGAPSDEQHGRTRL
jgi:general stress protein 26